MSGGAEEEEAVWAQCEAWMSVFKQHVDGVSGARAFFTAIAPLAPMLDSAPSAASVPRRHLQRDRGGAEGVDKRRRGE